MGAEQTKILVIDDNGDNLISLKALIGEAFRDAITLTALSGKEGLERAVVEDPDVILLDIVMPDMDGYDVCRKLKQDRKLSDIPVVFVTALKGDRESRIRALECGAEAFLAKPIDESELTAQIRAMARIKAANRAKQDEKARLARLIEEQTRELKEAHAAELRLLLNLEKENEARRTSEEELRTIEDRHRIIIQTAMDGFWLTDVAGRLLEVNETYCQMSGYRMQELLTMCISDLETGEAANITAARIRQVMERGDVRYETRHRRKDGSSFDVEVSAQYRSIAGGQIVAFLRDISERKQTEEDIKKKNAEIEQFIYTVSHDLRSPLVTVKTFLGYLAQDIAADEGEQIAKDIEFIDSATTRMEALLNELLEMSRIGRAVNPHETVAFLEIVSEAQDALAGQITSGQVDIRVSTTDPTLCGDRRRLLQVWQNLLDNSLKYMGDQTQPLIEFGVGHRGGETVFTVCDNGIGIAPEYHEKVFGIFEQLDRRKDGVGMGLTMVKRIVEMYDGRIWVESRGEGAGACFNFTLPGAVLRSEHAAGAAGE